MSNASAFLGRPGQKILISALGEFYAVFSEKSGLTMCLTPLTDELLHKVTNTGAHAWKWIHPWAMERDGATGTHLWAVAMKEAPEVAVARMSWSSKGVSLLTVDPAALSPEQHAVVPYLMGAASEVWPEIWASGPAPTQPRVIFSQFGPSTPPAEA